MIYFPFNKLKNYMGKRNEESDKNISHREYEEATRIAWAISLVAKHTPWESKCLVQSLTAQYFLNKRKITSTLYLGVSKEKLLNPKNITTLNNHCNSEELIAHSWIRCGDFFVTGGNGEHYAIVAKFKK